MVMIKETPGPGMSRLTLFRRCLIRDPRRGVARGGRACSTCETPPAFGSTLAFVCPGSSRTVKVPPVVTHYDPPVSLLPDLVTPLDVAASCAKIVTTFASVPPGTTRNRASRDRRDRAYSEFQRAAHDLDSFAVYLKGLSIAGVPPRKRYLRTVLSMAETIPLDDLPFRGLGGLLRAAVPMAKMAVAGDIIGDLLHRHAAYHATDRTREAVSTFEAALTEVRMAGRPGPQEQAEKVTALLGELLGRVSQSEKEFQDCQTALGIKIRDFVLAARADLDRRWWHRQLRPRSHSWQVWRPPATAWSTATPAPNSKSLIAEALEHR